jgi:hypothetical protein
MFSDGGPWASHNSLQLQPEMVGGDASAERERSGNDAQTIHQDNNKPETSRSCIESHLRPTHTPPTHARANPHTAHTRPHTPTPRMPPTQPIPHPTHCSHPTGPSARCPKQRLCLRICFIGGGGCKGARHQTLLDQIIRGVDCKRPRRQFGF